VWRVARRVTAEPAAACGPMTEVLEPSAILSLITGDARDPAPILAALREQDPVCWLPGFDVWLVTRHDDVRSLFADARLTTDPRAHERYTPPTVPGAARWLTEMPFRSTPSDPFSLGRRLVLAALTPGAVARASARIREVVEQFAAPLHGREGVVDLMEEFTAPVSTAVIGRLLGVPPKGEDEIRFSLLARRAARGIRPFLSDKKREETESAAVEIAEYVLHLVEERRTAPKDDLISDLVRASRTATQASDDEIVRVVAALVSAGTGTPGVACARALRALLQHPAQLSLLRNRRGLLDNAVEELLRYDNGLTLMPRYVVEEFELRGRAFRKGQLVALSLVGANRDPRVFPDPDRLDIGRDASDAVGFGHGPHYCTGANVARIEMRLMLTAALDFLPPGARLLEDQIRWSARGFMGQIKNLPVDFADSR
jgi:cytochrome P450